MVRISRWFIDIMLDNETLRWWSGIGTIRLGGQDYIGLGARWTPPDEIERSDSMKSETIELEFDSSRQTDDTDPIGRLLDSRWRRRPVRIRRLAWEPGGSPGTGIVQEDERGRIRNLSDRLRRGAPARLVMEIESGALAYLERRMATRTPASQKAVFPGDQGFDLIARLQGVTLPWRQGYKKTTTLQIELQERYEPFPRQLAIGRFITEGSFVAAFTSGPQRTRLRRIYALADHRIRQLDRVWINGELVRSTPLPHGVRTLIRLPNDKNENRCWITFYEGRVDQAADGPTIANEAAWTAAHRLQGVAYVIIEHWWDSDLPENYDYRFSGEGGFFYDRRRDETQGGFGPQRWDNPASWEYTTNAMVVADHYRSGIRIMSGSSALWFGVGETLDAVPYREFSQIAAHCDELVALKHGGFQRRYEINGMLSAADSHDKNLQKIADQMAARAIDQGGRIAIRPPMVRTPVVTLTDGDLIRGSESRVDPGEGIDDMVNTLEGRFINPANDYKADDYPPVSVEDYIDEDGGQIQDTLDLDLEIDGERAQRIALLKIEQSRCIFGQEEDYGSRANVVRPGDWFIRQSAMRGFTSGKMFIARKVRRFLNGSVRIRAREVYPDQLVWYEDSARDLSDPPDFPDTGKSDLPVPYVLAEAAAIAAGAATLPAVRLTHPGYSDFIGDEIICELGFSNGQSGTNLGIQGPSQFAKIPGNQETVDAFVGLPPSTAFAIRFRARQGERYSEWSEFQEFYSTSIYRIGDVATVGGRTAQEVIDGIDSNAENLAREILMRGAWQGANDALLWVGGERVGSVAIEARELGEFSVQSLALLGARSETGEAFILSGNSVMVPGSGQPGSSAISFQTMRSQLDSNRADITVLFESIDGVSTRLQFTTDVNGYVNGMIIYNDGVPQTSGVYFLTSNFAIVDPAHGVGEPFYPFAVVNGVVHMRNVVVDTVAANSIRTENLVDNSVSEAAIVWGSGGPWQLPMDATSENITPPFGSGWVTLIDTVYPHRGGSLRLDFIMPNYLNGGSYCAVTVQLLVDGQDQGVRTHLLNAFFGDTSERTYFISTLPAGNRNIVYRVRATRGNSGNGGTTPNQVQVAGCVAFIQEIKK